MNYESSIEDLVAEAVGMDQKKEEARCQQELRYEKERVDYWKNVHSIVRGLIPKILLDYCEWKIPDRYASRDSWGITCRMPSHLDVRMYGNCDTSRGGKVGYSGSALVVHPRIDNNKIVYDSNFANRHSDLGHAIIDARDNFHLIAKREAELAEILKKNAEQEKWAAEQIAARKAEPPTPIEPPPPAKSSSERLIEALDEYLNERFNDRQG